VVRGRPAPHFAASTRRATLGPIRAAIPLFLKGLLFVKHPLALAALGLTLIAVPAPAAAPAEFPGWQGMRAIHQEGSPYRLLAGDLDGDGRDELVAVNTRQSRLDIYRWQPAGRRDKPIKPDPDRPNELPMAPEWSKQELTLDDLPADAIAEDIDGDKTRELIVLGEPANRVLVYKADAKGEWKKSQSWDLLQGTLAGREKALLFRRDGAGKPELLVSFDQGVQTLVLTPGSRPAWLMPRESRGRLYWRLLDLDGDGDLDLAEWTPVNKQTVRWYENVGGKLLPAQVLFDQPIQGMESLAIPGKPAELLLLGGTQEGLLRRYALGKGKENPLGKAQALPMPAGNKAAWCGINLDGKPALVAVDPAQPRLRVAPLGDTGWLGEESYPIVGNVRALAAPQAQPGTLLLWAKDAADLHVSKWEGGRFTYPLPMPQSADVQDRRILALDMTGQTTWWAQRVGDNLDLYVWEAGQKEPKVTRFTGVGAKAERVAWPGGPRLLVQQSYATGAKLAVIVDGKTVVTEPAHLAKVDLGEFQLITQAGKLRFARLTDGVLQWLGDDLQPTDQIMLADGQRLASFVPLGDQEAWALEQGGGFVHRLKADDAGVLRVAESLKLPGGSSLVSDAVLGLMLVDNDRVLRLTRGAPWELRLIDSIDSRVGRPSGVREATIHRLFVTDATGDGQDDVIFSDDRRHQLTLLTRGEKKLEPLLSWPVFEDQAYPYGDNGRGGQVAEPRTVVALDADGDGRRDLAMLCQDRLLIYLAKDAK
jgi:hypothetical protein